MGNSGLAQIIFPHLQKDTDFQSIIDREGKFCSGSFEPVWLVEWLHCWKLGLCTPSGRRGDFRVHSKGYYVQGHEHENKQHWIM